MRKIIIAIVLVAVSIYLYNFFNIYQDNLKKIEEGNKIMEEKKKEFDKMEKKHEQMSKEVEANIKRINQDMEHERNKSR